MGRTNSIAPHHLPDRNLATFLFWPTTRSTPSGIGHKIVTDLIVDAIATVGLDMCLQNEQQHQNNAQTIETTVPLRAFPSNSNNNATTTSEGRLPMTLLGRRDVLPRVGWMANNPLVLDAQTDLLLVNNTYLMFTEQQKLVPLVHTDGFAFFKDK